MPILQLPPRLANQIAAGEVVERPASVVKELVENSIDAGATQIHIDIEKGGSRRIRIRDNGGGISKDELELALSRHATSKISTLDDLEAILSLGFRGEALASISSVARLTLASKPLEQDVAWQAFCEGRDMEVRIEPASHPDGTTVDVLDLFFNTPARRKFMRTEKTEFGHIDEVVRRIALGNPSVSFNLSHNGKPLRRYNAVSGDTSELLENRLKQVAGKRFHQEALYLQHHQEPFELSGWVAPPVNCRHQSDVQYVYVNGRMMKDKLLSHAIRQAYGQSLPDDRQPTYILYLKLPARDVDVNVHPAKHEVRFHQSRQVHDFVLSVVQSALAEAAQDMPGNEQPEAPATHSYQPPDPSRYQRVDSTEQSGSRVNEPATEQRALQQDTGLKGARSYQGRSFAGGNSPAGSRRSTSEVSAGQAWGMYEGRLPEASWQPACLHAEHWLLLQSGEQLGLIDVRQLQAIAQARRIERQIEPGLTGQPLLLPVQVSIPSAATIMSKYYQQISRLGFQFKLGKNDQIAVLQVPEMMRKADISASIGCFFEVLTAQSEQVSVSQRSDILHWLGEFAIESQYSSEQALYWWQQALALCDESEVTGYIRELDWEQVTGKDVAE